MTRLTHPSLAALLAACTTLIGAQVAFAGVEASTRAPQLKKVGPAATAAPAEKIERARKPSVKGLENAAKPRVEATPATERKLGPAATGASDRAAVDPAKLRMFEERERRFEQAVKQVRVQRDAVRIQAMNQQLAEIASENERTLARIRELAKDAR